MFFKLYHHNITKLLTLNQTPIKVYLALASFADVKSGHCWPGYRRLKAMTKITSGKHIRQALDDLIEIGLLECWKVGNKNHYRLKNDQWYADYLASEEWKAKSKAVRDRDNHRCLACNGSKRLEVHHLTYDNIGDEPLSDLVTWCHSCHSKHHGYEG